MTTNNEHNSSAQQLRADLSLQLITASLTAITILGGVFLYVRDKDNSTTGFLILSFLPVIMFSISAFFGGRGIELASRKIEGRRPETGTKNFGLQALTLALAILLGPSSILFVEPNKDASEINRLVANQRELQNTLNKYREEIAEMRRKINSLTVQVIELRRKTTKDR